MSRHQHSAASGRGGYPVVPDFKTLGEYIELYAQLKHERGARGIRSLLREAEAGLRNVRARMERLREDRRVSAREPDALDAIRARRPAGPRRLWSRFLERDYRSRIDGALYGRMAGNVLGAPVESWSVVKMQAMARENGDAFPPRDYWRSTWPLEKRDALVRFPDHMRSRIRFVPSDDDLEYTLLGLLILEHDGPAFTTDDVGRAWVALLPGACSAEKITLRNLRSGVPAARAAVIDNPYCHWIGAEIRADPWGYVAPGWPERAAELAHRDAWLSHRGMGIHGAMFFAATISAAFAVRDIRQAIEIGLTEIPSDCAFAQAVRWVLTTARAVPDYVAARQAIDRQFGGMSPVHAVNNGCAAVFGLLIGGDDFTRIIGETVAIGMDQDCTAASAGSIAGAVLGKRVIAPHWCRPFRDTLRTTLIGHRSFRISQLARRFSVQAAAMAVMERPGRG